MNDIYYELFILLPHVICYHSSLTPAVSQLPIGFCYRPTYGDPELDGFNHVITEQFESMLFPITITYDGNYLNDVRFDLPIVVDPVSGQGRRYPGLIKSLLDES
ncbi:hypothetical protein F4776DRAFT_638417 [Hypoxylon sp. NC0597]|nr:hypothetical protein F4776DRAFT_638417 [Hypoxylon sp. NC0597]